MLTEFMLCDGSLRRYISMYAVRHTESRIGRTLLRLLGLAYLGGLDSSSPTADCTLTAVPLL